MAATPTRSSARPRRSRSTWLVWGAALMAGCSLAGCRPIAGAPSVPAPPSAGSPVAAALSSPQAGATVAAPRAVTTALPPAKPRASHGGHLYVAYCTECHGTQGDGKGPAATALKPPPTNFRDKAYMNQQTLAYYYQALAHGVVGSAMTRWDAQLSEQDRWDLAAYVWSLAVPADNAKKGQPIYDANCGGCHGADGNQEAKAKLGRVELVRESRDELLGAIRQHHPDLAATLDDPRLPSRSDLVKAADYVWSYIYAPLVPVPVAVPAIPGLGGNLPLPQGEVCTSDA